MLKDRAGPIAFGDDPEADSTTPTYKRYADLDDEATATKELEDNTIPETDEHSTAEAFDK